MGWIGVEFIRPAMKVVNASAMSLDVYGIFVLLYAQSLCLVGALPVSCPLLSGTVRIWLV